MITFGNHTDTKGGAVSFKVIRTKQEFVPPEEKRKVELKRKLEEHDQNFGPRLRT